MFVALGIFALQVGYVAYSTFLFLLMVQGKKLAASSLSFIEILIYTIVLKFILENIGDILNLFAYCLGFSVGIYTGMVISEKYNARLDRRKQIT
jgi:uncharacterized protein YebE (UPF0316 family)